MQTLRSALVLVLLVGVGMGCSTEGEPASNPESSTGEEAELAVKMTQLQRWTQKAALALQARNPELADFYLHELHETVETIQEEVPTYEGYKIADRTETILVPSVEALDGALDKKDWAAVDRRVSELARSCNECHQTTDHGFIQIDLEDVSNPYAQDFSPRSE